MRSKKSYELCGEPHRIVLMMEGRWFYVCENCYLTDPLFDCDDWLD